MEEEEDNPERNASRKARPEVITFTEEETAQLAKIPPQESATVSERVLVQSAAEKDRISEVKDRQAELEAEPKHPNCCSYCPKSFKKPSDLVRWARPPYPWAPALVWCRLVTSLQQGGRFGAWSHFSGGSFLSYSFKLVQMARLPF